MSTRTLQTSVVAIGLALAALTATGCSDDSGSSDDVDGTGGIPLSITDPWSRQPAEGQTNTAVYGVIENGTERTLGIIAASSPSADRVELHETVAGGDGTMSMQELPEGFVVPPSGELVLEPGGPHVMLFGIDPDDYEGPIEVTLVTDLPTHTLTFDAEVREIGG